MSAKNIFEGDNYQALLAGISYQLLMTREWIAYSDIMLRYMAKSPEEITSSISKCNQYGELKKVFPKVCAAIKDICGDEAIEIEGNNRNKRYRYIGENKDPLKDMLNAKAINDLKAYWRFCQDSAGFFPISWLEHFFKGSLDLLDIKKKENRGEQIVNTSIDRILVNMDFLPILYEAITNHKVLNFQYHPFGKEPFNLVFHAHYLKEYNGRWFVFGKAQGIDITPFTVALDRISNKPEVVADVSYMAAEKGFYKQYFENIIGVSRRGETPKSIFVIHTKSLYIHGLVVTKPFHHSQKETKPFGPHPDGNYGEITIEVCPNHELAGRILSYGKELEVISPQEYREKMIDMLKEQLRVYLEKG